MRSGENDGALVAANRVLTQRPRDPDALFIKGHALYRKGDDYGAAVDVLDVYPRSISTTAPRTSCARSIATRGGRGDKGSRGQRSGTIRTSPRRRSRDHIM